ncbi:hypothetical protein [Sphingopyxis sp. PET50]|uniref:hypothetical protein n=1 Tax=Sphingopyxis sp. PET50 TaxID=2976533 RepID=UPI0021AE6FB6|nr:hypothetical protein [Sphingopyxis sp. PET50]
MPNGPEQAAYWRDFVIARCGYPNAELLARQFEGAELAEFCECGCNSFSICVRPGTPPLVRKSKQGGVVFSADFLVTTDRQLEIMLSVDAAGNLDRVDVTCNANSSPVPHALPTDLEPYHVRASKHLITADESRP